MTQGPHSKRARVMIVEEDLDFGIKLADWLAAHGYQAVLVRSVVSAIDECKDLNPQAVFIGLSHPEPEACMKLHELYRVIESSRPPVPVVTMGYRTSENLIHVVTSGGVRHVLVQPIAFTHIGRLLQAELNRTAAPQGLLSRGSVSHDGGAVENRSHEYPIDREAPAWIR